jgi:hypothetical protein
MGRVEFASEGLGRRNQILRVVEREYFASSLIEDDLYPSDKSRFAMTA